MISMRFSHDLAGRLEKVFKTEPVLLAYLFGSHARGEADAESDVDIAVLAHPTLSRDERHALKLHLMRTCADALSLPIEKMDIVLLQDVPVLLQYNVVRQGGMLFERNTGAGREYEIAVERQYEDERFALEQETNLTLQRILSHTV